MLTLQKRPWHNAGIVYACCQINWEFLWWSVMTWSNPRLPLTPLVTPWPPTRRPSISFPTAGRERWRHYFYTLCFMKWHCRSVLCPSLCLIAISNQKLHLDGITFSCGWVGSRAAALSNPSLTRLVCQKREIWMHWGKGQALVIATPIVWMQCPSKPHLPSSL